MPNYEYKCTQDGSRFEIWQEVGAAAPPCPTCGAVSKKVFQPPRVIFKGSGFYVTDLRSEQSAAKSKSEAKETAEAPSDSGTSETKAEAKTDAKATPAASPDAPAAKSEAKTA